MSAGLPPIVARRHSTRLQLLQGGEDRLELAFRARTQDVELEPERTRRLLVHALLLLNTAASLDAAVPAPTSVTDAPAHTSLARSQIAGRPSRLVLTDVACIGRQALPPDRL